jgi:hypothetical protein
MFGRKLKKRPSNHSRVNKMLATNGKHFEHYRASVAPGDLSMSVNNAVDKATQRPGALMTPVADFRSPVSAAVFTINVTRATASINQTLPVPIFGVLDQESDWIEIMSQFLIAGTTYAVTRNADRKSLDFAFTSGMNTDIITVSVEEAPYVNLLIAGLDMVFRMQQIKMSISDVANQTQFQQAVNIFNRSPFGHNENDKFTPNQYKTDLQNQNDIRTINQIIDIDKQRTILVKMIPDAASISFDTFIQAYEKGQSAADLG